MNPLQVTPRITIVLLMILFINTWGLFSAQISGQDFNSKLFDDTSVLEITLIGDLGDLLDDKSEDPDYYPVKLLYEDEVGKEHEISIKSKTRGNFRRLLGRCKYLPLWLNFENSETKALGIFEGQKKLKLVVPCRGEKYILREWMAYKILNILTPLSFKVRLVNLKLMDKNKDKDDPFFAILLESEEQVAWRNECIPVVHKLRPTRLQKNEFLRVAVFEYLIGNTDWSVEYLHNIKLIASDNRTQPYPVPYDFDHAGIVSAPYAKPVDGLGIRSVKDRIYRGYCLEDLDSLIPIFEEFNNFKKEIYALYNKNQRFEKKYHEFIVEYLDSFYEIINEEKKWRKIFAYPCDPRGPGNIIISGLNSN